MVRKGAFLLFLLLFSLQVLSQPDMGDDPTEGIPIDGGIVYLIAGGIVLGIKKFVSKKK